MTYYINGKAVEKDTFDFRTGAKNKKSGQNGGKKSSKLRAEKREKIGVLPKGTSIPAGATLADIIDMVEPIKGDTD